MKVLAGRRSGKRLRKDVTDVFSVVASSEIGSCCLPAVSPGTASTTEANSKKVLSEITTKVRL